MEFLVKIKERLKRVVIRKPYSDKSDCREQAIFDEELKPGSRLWLILLCLSSAVIVLKYLSDYGMGIFYVYKSSVELDIDVSYSFYQLIANIFHLAWGLVCRLQWILVPTLFSTAFVGFSWAVLYKDSNIPGVNPPTPFSPSNYRSHCDRSMDFSYALTGIFGILIFLRMLYQSL
ncbi:uncharacterized protein LOC124155351 [Ischnura elegans]|uniref:uncharacterized protein LOC124155351 n=1 Tax=Ischnura elegans TaxID=197161 RepID=UPI001ED89026|nr:uncharacterized protein LOC124155351 [Ischnura elegans]